MSDKCRTGCAASLSTWDADPSVSPTAGMSGLQWLMMETLTLHHFRQHASAGYCCHYRKNYIFFDREIVHDIFFFNWLSWEAHTRQPTRLLWVQCLSAWTDMLTVSWKTNSVPVQLWETPRTWHDHQMVCYGSNHQQNSCLHYTYIYLHMAYTCKYMYKQTYIWIQKSNYLFQ